MTRPRLIQERFGSTTASRGSLWARAEAPLSLSCDPKQQLICGDTLYVYLKGFIS